MEPERGGYGGPPPGRNAPYGEMTQGGMGANGQFSQGAVLMVYGLNMDHFNCQKLFNLFCLYGNVVRVSMSQSHNITYSII